LLGRAILPDPCLLGAGMPQQRAHAQGTHAVLVVEDDPGIRDVLVTLLGHGAAGPGRPARDVPAHGAPRDAEDGTKILTLAGPNLLARVDALTVDLPPALVPRPVRRMLALATESSARCYAASGRRDSSRSLCLAWRLPENNRPRWRRCQRGRSIGEGAGMLARSLNGRSGARRRSVGRPRTRRCRS